MKLTQRQIKNIIREMLDADSASEVEAVEGVWSGDAEGEAKNLELDIDHPHAAGAEETTKEPEMLARQENLVSERTMKITKKQLRKIIKEEKKNLLQEGLAEEERLYDALDRYVDMLGQKMPPDLLKAEVLEFVEGYFADMAYDDLESGRVVQLEIFTNNGQKD